MLHFLKYYFEKSQTILKLKIYLLVTVRRPQILPQSLKHFTMSSSAKLSHNGTENSGYSFLTNLSFAELWNKCSMIDLTFEAFHSKEVLEL